MEPRYNASNSLSPMMFKKAKKNEQGGGTRNERWRSRSVENIVDTIGPAAHQKLMDRRGKGLPTSKATRTDVDVPPWKEVSLVKSSNPVITCVLPSLAMDFVASALLAVGATPLITEDPADIVKDLTNAKAVVVDVSAPHVIIESFLDHFKVDSCPLILVTSDCGTNDRKKALALRIIEESGPTLITGKLGDIYAVAQSVIEKSTSSDSEDESEDDKGITVSTPKVVLSSTDKDTTTSLPPALRRAKLRKASSPVVSPRASPCASPPKGRSAPTSPRSSPTHSPTPSLINKGIRKILNRKFRANSEGRPLQRVPTCIPRLYMKGQFRDTQMSEVSLEDSLEYGQKLGAHTKAFIHLYETNVITCGEIIVEITNNQIGMGNLHSILPCCGAVTAAVLACVNVELEDQEEILLKNCTHGLALYYVAAEEGAASATQVSDHGLVSPGTLREKFINALHCLDEPTVHAKAVVYAHMEGTSIKAGYQ